MACSANDLRIARFRDAQRVLEREPCGIPVSWGRQSPTVQGLRRRCRDFYVGCRSAEDVFTGNPSSEGLTRALGEDGTTAGSRCGVRGDQGGQGEGDSLVQPDRRRRHGGAERQAMTKRSVGL